MTMKLVLVRGISGVGKSTFVDNNASPDDLWGEADMYFLDMFDNYVFDASKLKKAHNWCFTNAIDGLSKYDTVWISNTFTTIWEMEKYVNTAHSLGAEITIVSLENESYGSVHNVPEDKMTQQKERFVSGRVVWEAFKDKVAMVSIFNGETWEYLKGLNND